MYASEYAKSRGLPTATVRRLCSKGEIPSLPVGRKYFLNPDEADAVIERIKQECIKPDPPAPARQRSVTRRRTVDTVDDFESALKAAIY